MTASRLRAGDGRGVRRVEGGGGKKPELQPAIRRSAAESAGCVKFPPSDCWLSTKTREVISNQLLEPDCHEMPTFIVLKLWDRG